MQSWWAQISNLKIRKNDLYIHGWKWNDWRNDELFSVIINIWIIDIHPMYMQWIDFNFYIQIIFLRKRNNIGVHVEANHSARNGTHWTSWIAETTHRPWIVGGSENSTSLHAVLQDSRWPTLSTSGMTLACAGTSNCIQMQLFSRIPHSLSACPSLSRTSPTNDPFYQSHIIATKPNHNYINLKQNSKFKI